MSDTYRRGAGDQIALGYRQLPSVGSDGLDLKTLVYAGFGVALGILVGTVLADGSWRALNPLAQHNLVQAVSSGSGPADHAAAKTAQTPPLQAQSATHESPQSSPTLQPPAIQASANGDAPAVRTVPANRDSSVTRNVSGIREASIAHEASSAREASDARSLPRTHRVLAAHRRRPIHGLAAWRRHFVRRSTLRRHRLRTFRRAAIPADLPPAGAALKPDDTSTLSAFTVEGELSVSGYDGLRGTIETYEGEAFTLPRAANPGTAIHGADISQNIHYRCDQFGSCALIAGQFVLDAKRTR